jgi:hypothetical protein
MSVRGIVYGGSPFPNLLQLPESADIGKKLNEAMKAIKQGWSLSPGRCVGLAAGEEVNDANFREQFEELTEHLKTLNAEAGKLEQRIAGNAARIMEA